MALSIGEIFVRVGADTTSFHSKMGRVQTQLSQTSAISRGVVTGLAGVAVVLGTAGLAGIKLAASLEQTQVAFETMLGGAEQAAKFIEQLRVFAKNTPFEFTDLIRYAQQLKGIGFGANRVIPILTAVGDAAAGIGGNAETIGRIVRAFGQMRAKGKASAEEMMQLSETSIPVWDMLATGLGVDIPKAMDMMEKRVIDGTDVVNILVDQMERRFGGMMEKQAKTLAGQWSNIKDSSTEALTSIGQLLVETFDVKTKLSNVTEFLTGLNDKLDAVKRTLKETGELDLGPLLSPGAETTLKATAGAIVGLLTPAIVGFGIAAGGAAIAAAPLWATGAAIAVVIDGITSKVSELKKAGKDVTGETTDWLGLPLEPLGKERNLYQEFLHAWDPITQAAKDTFVNVRTEVGMAWPNIKSAVADWVGRVFSDEDGASGQLTGWADSVSRTWDDIKAGIPAKWTEIKSAVATWAGNVLNGAGGLKSLFADWVAEAARIWDIIQGFVQNIKDALTGATSSAAGGGFTGGGGAGEGGGGGTAEGAPPVQGPPFIPTLPPLQGPLLPPMPPVAEPPPLPPLPDIERQGGGRHAILMADGGLVTRPTFAMVGEAGPEAVIPLDRLGSMGGAGPITVNATFNINGANKDPRQIAEEVSMHVADKLVRQLRLKGITVV